MFAHLNSALDAFGSKIVLLNPRGVIAYKEFDLMLTALALMLVVVVVVFSFTFLIVWKYRVGNRTSKPYSPEWDHNVKIELVWWAIPLCIVIFLSVITWTSSHDLDPFKPIASNIEPITIEVVALDWKWLFIYPQEGIATVNMIEFPAQTPINFVITSDAPMNSFWIPQLGGQIYAMPGMSTQLHLESFGVGTYDGLSANISGAGFAGMKFRANSVSQADFDQWVANVKQSPNILGQSQYAALSAPSQNVPVTLYSAVDKSLYNDAIMKYMMPQGSSASDTQDMQDMPGMSGMTMGN